VAGVDKSPMRPGDAPRIDSLGKVPLICGHDVLPSSSVGGYGACVRVSACGLMSKAVPMMSGTSAQTQPIKIGATRLGVDVGFQAQAAVLQEVAHHLLVRDLAAPFLA